MSESAADFTIRTLADSKAILENDHFVYIAGDHGSGWIDKDAFVPHTERVQKLCSLLADRVKGLGIEIVCGPAIGGLIISQWTAHALGVTSVYAEHDPHLVRGEMRGHFVLRRGYDHLVAGKNTLVVDDIVSTGHSVRQTIEAVRHAGGLVRTVACLVTRGNVAVAGLGVDQFIYLAEYRIPSWPAQDCPLCRAGVPVNTKYAHGLEFVERLGTRERDAGRQES